ncbi:MAG: hypothetical protein LBR56_03065 [Sporomusaceae bacterium]|jgi:hypothetical protein|nr:hypothetical protein [Sporomusaceae bacterium]
MRRFSRAKKTRPQPTELENQRSLDVEKNEQLLENLDEIKDSCRTGNYPKFRDKFLQVYEELATFVGQSK